MRDGAVPEPSVAERCGPKEEEVELEGISTSVKTDVKVVYGEKYDQPKMGEFLGMWTGGKVGGMEDVAKWAEGVEDLRVRLIKRGKKGERI